MKITITKRQEYVNDEAKPVVYELELDYCFIRDTEGNVVDIQPIELNFKEIKALRDELNKLKLDK